MSGAVPGMEAAPVIGVSPAAEDAGAAAQLRALKRKNAKRRNTAIIAGLLTAGALGGAIFAAQSHLQEAKLAEAKAKKPKVDEELVAKKESLRQTTELAKASSPTAGKPISLNCLPLGAKIIISLRPAELWKNASRGEELRYCLGPFGEWVDTRLKELCRFEPAQIEHVLIGVIPQEVGTPPKVAAVVTLAGEVRKSELLVTFGGETNETFGYPIHVNGESSYLLRTESIGDQRRTMVAIAPSGVTAEEMAKSVDFSNPQSDGIDALIMETDRDRHLTVIFEPRSVVLHRDTLFPKASWVLVDRCMEFFNDEEIETVAWSMHFGESGFHSQVLMRNQSIIREHLLQDEVRERLRVLPYDLWHMVEKMNPQTLGPRKVIGRFPAMMQVFAKSTIGGTGTRYAQLTTTLPERATPNLALGALLTWDESTRTDFNRTTVPSATPSTSGSDLPALIADRLKKKIDVEFARQPLQEAFAYIADETGCEHEIDGDALKLSGYTKNMPYELNMQGSALEIIGKMVTWPMREQLCLVIQEDRKRFLITTIPVAKEQGLTPYQFK